MRQEWGPGETIQAASEGLAKMWSGSQSESHCFSVPLCSQRANDKVLVRLEVLLPLYRQES